MSIKADEQAMSIKACPALRRLIHSTLQAAHVRKPSLDRDFIVSVLESSATKRDAKSYLQKYASNNLGQGPPRPLRLIKGSTFRSDPQQHDSMVNVAIVVLRNPQVLVPDILDGIARTLSQLRALGLVATVVLDCGIQQDRQVYDGEAFRLCEAIDNASPSGQPGAKLADGILVSHVQQQPNLHYKIQSEATYGSLSAAISDPVHIDDQGLLARALQHGIITVIPSLSRSNDLSSPLPNSSGEVVLAVTKFLAGLQFNFDNDDDDNAPPPEKLASIERIILLDSLGAIPIPGTPNLCHCFINLEQDYDPLMTYLMNNISTSSAGNGKTHTQLPSLHHAANLHLVKHTLALLPPSSSALITTPLAAANTRTRFAFASPSASPFDFTEITGTRRNPLLHNLLTDRPASSPSLPLQRVLCSNVGYGTPESSMTTLIKRGMPVTIYPDPKVKPWTPPEPSSPQLRLTDTCIDMSRLLFLIEDSFDRRLHVKDYLQRVNDKLAGIIIAGEYEGAAILTWERPPGIKPNITTYQSRHLVPYLDKFAVLKRCQGSAGVADILFNAMVQDCFPAGVCWRSRKDNPVNRWYFERSAGTCKLPGSNWTMFWTTTGLCSDSIILRDYEAVCRGIQPSWIDNQRPAD